MAETTYSVRAIVLRRTRLKETDLIVTAIASDGRQIRAVAKGARKPSSAFSARLDLYTEVDLLCAKGRGDLDIVKEARIVRSHAAAAVPEFAAAAALVAETAERLTHAEMASPKLFALTEAAFVQLGSMLEDAATAASSGAVLAVCAAYMLKAFAFTGFRPSFNQCAVCGSEVSAESGVAMLFSVTDGGAVCPECRTQAASVHTVPAHVIAWADYLLRSPFDSVRSQHPDCRTSESVLRMCRDWMRVHAGVRLKSLGFIFDCGLF